MKQDWEIKTIAELEEEGIVKLGRGMVISKKDLADFPGDFPVFSSAKLNNGIIGRYGKYMFDEELITWSVDGGGDLFYRDKHKFSITNVGGFCRILNQDILSYKYLYYVLSYLHSTIKFDWVKKAHPSVLRNEYKTIPVPPLNEQKRIVALLDEAFEKIDKVKANTEKNLANAKELFESLLIQMFVKGINTKKWTLEKLEKYNKVVVGYVGPISKEYTNDENSVLLLSTKNINDKGVSLEKLTRINLQFHNKNKKSQLLPGDILVARHGKSGQSVVIPSEIKEAHALNVIVIKKSETLSSEYISFLLNSGVLDKIAASKGGSVQEIINTSVIKDLIIPVPSVKEQQDIVQQLEALSAETKKLETIYKQKSNDLEELKKSVLQKAFNGELKATKVGVRL